MSELIRMNIKVSACLINWKRPQNMGKIIESLLRWDFIDEIIIRDNSKGKNIINYGRYTSAKCAKNNLIYTQDDDCIVDNLDEIYEQACKYPHHLVHSGTADYERVIPDNRFKNGCQMAMAGWGSFFQKDWISVLDQYTDKYGKDFCFYRETDRIFSILLKQFHLFVPGKIIMLEGITGPEALSSQPDHIKYKMLAIKRALKLADENFSPHTIN